MDWLMVLSTWCSTAINLGWIKDLFFDHMGGTVRLPTTEKTRRETFVTGGTANLFNLQQYGIAVAIEVNGMDLLHMPTFFTFVPQPVAAARKIHGTPT
jgi:hypothetical protein